MLNVQYVHPGNCIHYMQDLSTPLYTRDQKAGFDNDNITHRRHTDMRKVASPSTTPGGKPIFKERDISSIETMIKKWEAMEGGEGEFQGEERESGGRRVSELARLFEVGGERGDHHITNSGGGRSYSTFSNGQSSKAKLSAAKFTPKKIASKSKFDILKIKTQSKIISKSKTSSNMHDGTESRGERDWPSSYRQAANQKPGISARSRKGNYGQ